MANLKDNNRGFTLAEIMIASLVLVIILVGLLASYVACFDLNETSKNVTLAMNAAQAKMAEITDYSFANACSDYNATTFTVSDMPDSRGVIYIYPYSSYTTNSSCNNCTSCDYKMLRVVISVSWRQKSGRIIGEDNGGVPYIAANALNGALNTGEDTNSNGKIDSPVQLVAFLTAG
jgi:prepilin-type N-terminal cleavage/methylation domain-containing protein